MNWQDKARSLWGRPWKSTLASTAKVNVRTVRRWSTGESRTPLDIIDRIDDTYDVWRKK